MAKVRSFFGYCMAVLSGLIMLATLPALIALPEPLLKATGLRTAAKYTGGDVAQTLDHGAYRTLVHQPAFEALFGESRLGFVQVNWAPLESLPPRIDEEIDVDGDGQPDLRLVVDTAQAQAVLTPRAAWVLDLEGAYRLKESLMVRVRLRNPR